MDNKVKISFMHDTLMFEGINSMEAVKIMSFILTGIGYMMKNSDTKDDVILMASRMNEDLSSLPIELIEQAQNSRRN